MRRFVVLVSLLGLSACGGGVEAEQQPESPAQTEQGLCTGNAWECFCAQYKTQATCNQASSGARHCVWQNKCLPTYE
ncbi:MULTISPECIES: hypothetical protein [Myxococcus]|uniref:hypothetical protein n=1 Tax=Myxococcus TaxID=32 RepID=UPI001143E17B|nr:MULTISPECIES: hypothetical protein [Myxococcus]MCK8500885.1 hypothetical protein [Myxococcus fulvus]